MLKSILNLTGIQQLSKTEQNKINGKGSLIKCGSYLGDTGQYCVRDSDCRGSGDPVCYRNCCNLDV